MSCGFTKPCERRVISNIALLGEVINLPLKAKKARYS